ncbi:MAG: chemotaxis protein CheX [Anaerolineales bacterium]|nr:chemotaxis protein CheX [Anaerolineales bacterium]MBP6208563.1 chemotaxis protein CheX [Anaerolineales bacterium]
MNVKFLNPFVTAAHDILHMELHGPVQRGELKLENGPYRTDDATVIISLVGAVDGTVFYSMSKESAIQFASALMGEKFEGLNALAQSGIAELGNVITGQASMRLAEAGFESNISTPSLLIGKGASISTLEYPRLVVPLTTEAGSLTIHLSLRENLQTNLKTPQIAIPAAFETPTP